ncbi:DUF262 domain-containing protein [Bradyrhizobium oligotrophicum]|uniref:DUF262 domain-containing protein n=1 Tax=Bradyrhizobium oligotrophicum TaxID=44255 RepID=UPI003EB99F44
MKSDTFTVQQVFQVSRQYRVPFYQRACVWNKEEQWQLLWDGIRERADARMSDDGAAPPYFLGAIVLEPQKRTDSRGVETFHIIDGQQRLTTLQYLLVALRMVMREGASSSSLALIDELRCTLLCSPVVAQCIPLMPKLPVGQFAATIWLVSSGKSPPHFRPSRASSKRGVRESSRALGVGCGGRVGVAARIRERTNNFDTDGEIAWSWPPDAEVKLADVLGALRVMGATKLGPQGERV